MVFLIGAVEVSESVDGWWVNLSSHKQKQYSLEFISVSRKHYI